MSEKKWHSTPLENTYQQLNTDPKQGLSSSEVESRFKKYGPNILNAKPPRSIFSMLIDQLKEPLVFILIIAAFISGMLGEIEDTIVILFIVVLNAIIGVFQENKAENAIKALKDMTKPSAKIIREGKTLQINAEELVPGDIVLLDAGDSVPADLRIIEAVSLNSDESALTGESLPVEKNTETLSQQEVSLGDRKNMLFMGTTITGGRAKAIAVETGMHTQLGKIAQLIDSSAPESTPLQKRLAKLGKTLGIAALLIVFIVFLLGIWRGENLVEMLLIAISLAVAAVPEGLPAVVTIVLALGVTRMSHRKAIIRKLPAVETLGTSTVICSDKTGTLTKNEMTVTKIFINNEIINVSGTGYNPKGDFIDQSNQPITNNQSLEQFLLGGMLNNDAALEKADSEFRVIGDPTEGALVVAAVKYGLNIDETKQTYPRLAEIVFDSNRKMMTTFHNIESSIVSFTKGAPDVILSRCSSVINGQNTVGITDEILEDLLQINYEFASKGQRVLALSCRQWPKLPSEITSEQSEKDLSFLGFFVIQDPPRPEAKKAVELCHSAGIRTIMITGDHLYTAEAIAAELNIHKAEDKSMTGEQLEKISDDELVKVVNQITVFARVSPEHKLRIVSALKHHGHIVAMTGDGVNDAPALKKADIGAAMGISGTEVAKEASDMILQDDNFATIVKAVEEGRTIYNNIRGSIQYLLSCNTGEITAIFFSLLMGLGSPLNPIMILWMNLVTDGPPALALGLEPPQKGIMQKPPRDPKEGLFSNGVGIRIILQGLLIGLISLFGYWLALQWGRTMEEARTIAFITMALSQLVHSLNVRSVELSVFKVGLWTNRSLIIAILISAAALSLAVFTPFMRDVFNTAILRPSDWGLVLGLSIIPLLAVEISKFIANRN